MKSEDTSPKQEECTPSTGKKAWKPLHLKVLDVPSNTNAGAGRLQPGEAVNFYRNS